MTTNERETDRTYEVVTMEGRMRLTIPESWKVTYGPVSPTGKGYGAENCLRIYEDSAKDKQRAIFTSVLSFRDLSIPVQRLLVREKGKEKWEINENGKQRISSVKYERKWVDEAEIEDAADSGEDN